jgi:hypothetical protein
MNIDEQVKLCNEAIGSAATAIAQAYAEFGDLTGYLLGQTSSTLQLSLFTPLSEETSTFVLHLLSDHPRLKEAFMSEISDAQDVNAYQDCEDCLTVFVQRCQQIVARDSEWLSMQKRKKMPLTSISDKGYVTIRAEGTRLQNFIDHLPCLG